MIDRETCPFCGLLVDIPCDVPPDSLCEEAHRVIMEAIARVEL